MKVISREQLFQYDLLLFSCLEVVRCCGICKAKTTASQKPMNLIFSRLPMQHETCFQFILFYRNRFVQDQIQDLLLGKMFMKQHVRSIRMKLPADIILLQFTYQP